MGDFGAKFRKAREKKELSLDDVSNVTKINARMLRAIEEEHFDDLPGGVFNKGFIRAYAKHLGLDAEEAVTDYLASLRQAQIAAQEIWEPHAPSTLRPNANGGKTQAADAKKKTSSEPVPPKPPTPVVMEELPELQLPRAEDVRPTRKEFLALKSAGVPWRIVAAAALVFALGIFLWIRHSNTTRAASPPPKAAAVTPARPAAALTPTPPAQTPSPTIGTASTAQTSTPVPSQTQPQQPPQPAPTTPAVSPSPAPASDTSNDVTVKHLGKSAPKASGKSTASLTLVIRATENSWISVFGDGQLVTQETLIAPAQTSVRASREVTVRVGNAAGVTFVWNGKEIPAQGGEAEAKNFVFDSSGMKVSAASPPAPQNGIP